MVPNTTDTFRIVLHIPELQENSAIYVGGVFASKQVMICLTDLVTHFIVLPACTWAGDSTYRRSKYKGKYISGPFLGSMLACCNVSKH